jgi:hypothetical protein
MPATATRPDTGRSHSSPPLKLFCESTLRLEGKPVGFQDRPYIDDILAATKGNLVLRAGRQVEKSTFLTFRIAYELLQPGSRVLLVCPREDQAKLFMRSRFLPLLENSRLLEVFLKGREGTSSSTDIRFGNGSQLYVRSAFRSADTVRGVSADLLICDEYQDIAAGFLPVLKETLAHSERPKTILTGTPKDITNHIEDAFARSTRRAWIVRCESCHGEVLPTEKSVGPDNYHCPACRHPVDWRHGTWVAENPDSTWGEGFWLPQVITPWSTPSRLREKAAEYDRDRLRNEVFGLPTSHGMLAITQDQLEACCSSRPMAASLDNLPPNTKGTVVLGIDWGCGLNEQVAVVIASMCPTHHRLRVWYWAMLGDSRRPPLEEVSALCDRFGVNSIFTDALGGGSHRNRELWDRLGRPEWLTITGLEYGTADGPLTKDGVPYKRVIDRTKWIGGLFSRIRIKSIEFPALEDCRHGFAHVGCEQMQYNHELRTSVYQAAAGHKDDLLHPLVYVLFGLSDTRLQVQANYYLDAV